MNLFFVRTGSLRDETLLECLEATGHRVVHGEVIEDGSRAGAVFACVDESSEPAEVAKVAYLIGTGVDVFVVARKLPRDSAKNVPEFVLPVGFEWLERLAFIVGAPEVAVVRFASRMNATLAGELVTRPEPREAGRLR